MSVQTEASYLAAYTELMSYLTTCGYDSFHPADTTNSGTNVFILAQSVLQGARQFGPPPGHPSGLLAVEYLIGVWSDGTTAVAGEDFVGPLNTLGDLLGDYVEAAEAPQDIVVARDLAAVLEMLTAAVEFPNMDITRSDRLEDGRRVGIVVKELAKIIESADAPNETASLQPDAIVLLTNLNDCWSEEYPLDMRPDTLLWADDGRALIVKDIVRSLSPATAPSLPGL